MSGIVDGKTPPGFDKLVAQIVTAGNELGWPCFLRTGHTSAKHDWDKTCFVPGPERVSHSIMRLVECSMSAHILGLPCNVWVVREMLKTSPAFLAFEGFPVTQERRIFVRDGQVECNHEYWFDGPLEDEPDFDSKKLAAMNLMTPEDTGMILLHAHSIASSLKGYWSIDFLKTADRGWVMIDMAAGDASFHMPGCPKRPAHMA